MCQEAKENIKSGLLKSGDINTGALVITFLMATNASNASVV